MLLLLIIVSPLLDPSRVPSQRAHCMCAHGIMRFTLTHPYQPYNHAITSHSCAWPLVPQTRNTPAHRQIVCYYTRIECVHWCAWPGIGILIGHAFYVFIAVASPVRAISVIYRNLTEVYGFVSMLADNDSVVNRLFNVDMCHLHFGLNTIKHTFKQIGILLLEP